ncbi:MAG: cysteine desulfurase family protein [bacterium]|nr:cysteine desulfurase family protein [bacterium]
MSSKTKKTTIYLDNAAATPTDPRVIREMVGAMPLYANPSSFNDAGRVAREKLDESRTSIARFLGGRSNEIVFTSSGSEANNLALLGMANSHSKPGEIITTPIEHPSVLESLKSLENKGWKITYIRVDEDGLLDLKDFEEKLNSRVALVSIIYANHEIGTIQPIAKISKLVKKFRAKNYPFFHVDACQATGYLDLDVNNLGVDMITFNGAKIYGPRGIGVLYIRTGTPMRSLIFGGDQEHGLRAGTENLYAIVGLAKAVSLINKNDGKKIARLRDYFLEQIKEMIPEARLNGPTGLSRLANNINISIPNLNSENLLLELDKYGIYASAGSACTARSVEPSHVLRAIGVEEKYIRGALRFSLGRQTTKKEIDYVLKVMPRIVRDLRKRYN